MKTSQKLLSVLLAALLLALTMAVCAVPASALAESGSCGFRVNWTFNAATGALTISGTGQMNGYAYSGSPFYDCSEIRSVTIENGVTNIGRNAFRSCNSLSRVSIPATVKTISEGAFCGCGGLKSLLIPEGVTEIGAYSFSNSGLETVSLPDTLTSIGSYAFENTYLTSVIIPNGVTQIGAVAFCGCRSLKTVTIPRSVTEIGNRAFGDAPLQTVNYTGSREDWETIALGEHVFANWDSASDKWIPYSVTINYDYDPDNPIVTPEPTPANLCHWCGQVHEGFFQKIIARIFGNKY